MEPLRRPPRSGRYVHQSVGSLGGPARSDIAVTSSSNGVLELAEHLDDDVHDSTS
jgi:hypothetical protein